MSRWIALHCAEETDELQARHPNAFLLLCQIARRAKWKDCPITKLKAGEAFIGDWQEAGLASQMVYRTAKKVLLEAQLATFQPTNKGTVARLSNRVIFSNSNDADNEQANSPATGKQQADNEQITTNNKDTRYTDTRTQKKKAASAPPPLPFDSPEFAQAWERWETHLREKKAKPTASTVKAQLSKLEVVGELQAIAAIDEAIERGWRGLFPKGPNEPNPGPSSSRSPSRPAVLNLGPRGDQSTQTLFDNEP